MTVGQFLGGSEPNANITQVQTHNGITALTTIFPLIFRKDCVYTCVCAYYVYSCVIRERKLTFFCSFH